MVEGGLRTPAKKNAFLAWPGLSQKSSVPDLWPSNISFGDRFLGSRAFSIFCRRVSHIKLVYQPSIPLEAKGYLAFGHGWFAPDVLKQYYSPRVYSFLFGSNLKIILNQRNEQGLFYKFIVPNLPKNPIDRAVNANVLLYLGEDVSTSLYVASNSSD